MDITLMCLSGDNIYLLNLCISFDNLYLQYKLSITNISKSALG